MATTASRFLRNTKSFDLQLPTISKMVGFSLVMFFISMGDAVMSYVSPIYFEDVLSNSSLMGLLIASSSVVGFLADLIIGKVFANKKYSFFLLWTGLLAILFPLIYKFLPPTVIVFLFGMSIWGIYFELLEFANFHFIHEHQSRDEHAKSFGILQSFRSIAWILAPIVSSMLLVNGYDTPFMVAIGFFVLGLIIFFFFNASLPEKKHHIHEKQVKRTLWQEFKIWRVLLKKVWPVWLFTIVIYLIDATFWTSGAVLSEELKHIHTYGSWLLPLYITPFLFAGMMTKKLGDTFGKKRVAFVAGSMSGLLLIAGGMISNISALLIIVFVSSLFTSVAIPEIMATSEDYVGRLKFFGNDMVGLERSAVSIGYVIGPATAGFLGDVVGHQFVFSIMGGLLFVFSLIALYATPRKIHLPQGELNTILLKDLILNK